MPCLCCSGSLVGVDGGGNFRKDYLDGVSMANSQVRQGYMGIIIVQPYRVVQESQNLTARVAKPFTSLHDQPSIFVCQLYFSFKMALRIGKRYTFNTCTSICQSLIIQPYLWTPFQGIFLSTLRWDCFAPAIRKGTLVGRPGEG